MTIFEIIEKKLEDKNVKISGILYLDCNENDTRITVYDMNMTTFAKRKVAFYLAAYNRLLLV